MAKMSLQEQLLKSGLVSAGQAKAVKSEKYKQAKQQHTSYKTADEVKAKAQQAQLEQAEKDRELNQRHQQEEERKQRLAQAKQLIEQHRLPKDKALEMQFDESFAYHFTDNNKVKTLYVSKAIREQIAQGRLAIAKLGKQYELVPAEIAEKIRARNELSVIVFNQDLISDKNKEDSYADYQVPDDLMW